MKRVLITGGAGFIGSHLTKKLNSLGYEIVIIDRLNSDSSQLKKDRLEKFLNPNEYTFYNSELSDTNSVEKIFEKNKFDVVCHLAAKTNLEFNTELYNRTNILGTINIFELAKKFKVPKVVFASSSMVYGNNTKLPFNENDNTDHPLSVYAASKKSDEVLAFTYHHLHKIKMIGLRLFTTYGAWGRPDMAISKFTEQVLAKKILKIHNHGKIRKDFTYIDDTISGIVAAIEANIDYELINLGSGKSTEIEKIINLIEKKLNITANKEYIPITSGDLPETLADIEKAKRILNYQSKISIEEGIKKYVDWYQKYHIDKV